MSHAAIMNLITKDTSKEKMREAYKNYPATAPKGFESFHASTVEPIVCEIPEGAKVLDCGCNDGAMMAILRDKGCDVTGVDVSDTALALAKEKGLNVINASAEELPFKDKTFDVVVLREVLVHIHEPVKALKEIRRVLKKNGFLLGSVPHANLERIAWDDKRLHHRYYNEESLSKDLSDAFDKTYLKVLTGAQFTIGFIQSSLADQPAEILFKSGGKNTKEWEHALLSDKKTLRVWFGPTQPPGDVYYRMIGYAVKMRKIKGIEVGFENFRWDSNDGCAAWQGKILNNGEGMPISSLAVHQLEKCLKVANPWVFQVTYHEDVLTFLECAKDVYKGKKLITEVDDWIFDLPAYNVASYPYKPGSEKERIAYDQLRLSDEIIVSTQFLKDSLLSLFPDKPVHVIPNSIDFDLWDKAVPDGKTEKKKDGFVRITYNGCANHSGDMDIVKSVLLALLEEYPHLEVIVAQDMGCFKDVKHPRFLLPNRWVNIIDYPGMMKGWESDIGIAPLRDNMFNRSKSNLRWLENSALNIPTVASSVKPFNDSIEHGLTGFLCKSKQDWYDSLKMLIESESLRKTVGRAAHKEVFEKFNMNDWTKKYAELLRGIRDASQ